MPEQIDFVVLWVDGSDPEWQALKEQYSGNTSGDVRNSRFRDWDNLQYWFRGVEKFAPWVNRVFFVTWGHLPAWLNTGHSKLEIVKHEDYIPGKYLPTFNSRTIELNFHRIANLAERFVLFNDDMFILDEVKAEDFFRRGRPVDCAVIMPNISTIRNSTAAIVANNMEIINTTFDKNTILRRNLRKWFNLKYRKHLFSTFCCLPYKRFAGFYGPHLPLAYLKESFREVWQAEEKILDESCLHRFRDKRGVNHWLIRYWQLVRGNFEPGSASIGRCYSITNNNSDIERAVADQSHKMICINDNEVEQVVDFEREKNMIRRAFQKILPEKSSFEL